MIFKHCVICRALSFWMIWNLKFKTIQQQLLLQNKCHVGGMHLNSTYYYPPLWETTHKMLSALLLGWLCRSTTTIECLITDLLTDFAPGKTLFWVHSFGNYADVTIGQLIELLFIGIHEYRVLNRNGQLLVTL